MNRSRFFRALSVCVIAFTVASVVPHADGTAQALPFTQDWSNTGLIVANDDWTGVPGIIGYLGDGMGVGTTAVNPQTILAPGTSAVDVIANQASANGVTAGGVLEFQPAAGNPVVALQGSGTARAPHLLLSVSTSGLSNITVAYNLRDIDGSADNAVQPVALQYRVGNAGNFTNVPAAFVSDATTGPSLATLVTAVSATLPADAAGKPLVQIRIITSDAVGSDEWVGIDDISITGLTVPQPTNPSGTGSASPASVIPGGSTLLTVVVNKGTNPDSTGLGVVADLTPIGGAASQTLYDDGTNGDVQGGDNTFSYNATVGAAVAPGDKTIAATITDAQLRSGTAQIALNVFVPITSVTISQVYGGGGNSGAPYKNDYIELYNRSSVAVDVSTWSVQYASSSGSSWQVTPLTGTIQPGTYYLVHEAAGAGSGVDLPPSDTPAGSIPMSGTNGKVALVASQSALNGTCATGPLVVDFVGYGTANCYEGAGAAPGLSNTTAAIRADGGATDTNNNAADFGEAAPSPKNSTGQPPTGTGTATPAVVDSGAATLLVVKVKPGAYPASTGLSVTANLSNIGAAAVQPFFDDATHGDVTAGDLLFSFSTTVTGTEGSKSMLATISDAQGRTTQTTFSVTIEPPPIAIHAIQGAGSQSSYAGQLVTTTGIVTAVRFGSFYIQTPDGQDDGDPNTSEGLLVFRTPTGLAVGDSVKVSGTVVEFVPSSDPQSPSITELANNSAFTILSHGNALPAPATLLASYTSAAGNFEQLERFEGMRVRADITAVTGTSSFRRTDAEEAAATSTSNGDFFAVITGVARPMREAGLEPGQPVPAGAPCCIPHFDGNPERLRVDSDGQTGAQKIEIVAGQTIAGFTGVLDYGFRSYTIVPDPQAWVPAGRGDALPVPVAGPNEFTVAGFNLERFFDTSDDPSIDDEMILTPAAYERRLAKASLAIRNVLRTPDVVGVEEVENLATLTELANRINMDAVAAGQPNPLYVAYLFEGNDVGGIDSGVLVKTARVDVISAIQVGKSATYVEPNGDVSTLNDRPPVVLEAAIRADGAIPYQVTVIVNHLRSLSGIDGSDGARIRVKRRAQAEFLASYIQGRQAANPAERIVSVGDYNAFNVNDGYGDLIGTIKGTPTPADQVLLASPDLVNPNLVSLGDTIGPDQYSFLFDGNAQTLDHILVSEPMFRRFSRFAFARNNADFPESFRSDATRPERISDHDAAVAFFTLPGAPALTLNGAPTMTVEAATSFVDPGATAVDEELGTWAVAGTGTVDTSVVGTYTLTYTASNGFLTTVLTRTVNVVDTTAPVLTLNGSAAMTIEAGSTWADPGATAGDTRAGNLTAAIVVTGTVNSGAVGTYTLTYTVSDGYNTATATRTVSVVDTTAPVLSDIAVSPSKITVPNHKMVDVTLTYTVSDITGATSCLVSVTSNEPINGPGDGNTGVVDWQVIDATHVRVRAERSGMGTGRIYTIAVTCTDASGNSTTRTAQVTVAK